MGLFSRKQPSAAEIAEEVVRELQQTAAVESGKCPQCGAPASCAEAASGFGPLEAQEKFCGQCAYAYPKEAVRG